LSWQISIAEWAGWIEEESVGSQAWVSLDEFDEDIRAMLEHAPFNGDGASSEAATHRRTTLRPGEQATDAASPEGSAADSFDSRPTIVRTTVDAPAAEPALDPTRLEVALTTERQGFEVELVPAAAGGAPYAEVPVRTGSTWPPGAPPPPVEVPVEEASAGAASNDLYIPTLTRRDTEPGPPPPPAARTGPPTPTLVVAPLPPPPEPSVYDEEDEDEPPSAASSQTSGVIMLSPEEEESLRSAGRADDAPPPPRSKIVIASAVSEREDGEPDELDASELEEQDEAPRAAPPPPKPVVVSHPPPPPPMASLSHDRLPPPRHRVPVFVRPSDAEEVGPDWVEEVFGEHFPAMGRQGGPQATAAEVDFFLELVRLPVGAAVLDVGCGDGAHTLALASRGFRVTGVDRSGPLIERARVGSEMVGAKASFVHGDIRSVELQGQFDAALCVGSMLGYRNLQADREILSRIRDLLRPDARMLLHVFNRDHVVGRLPARSWWQGQGCLVLDEATMDHIRNRLQVHRTAVFENGSQFEHRYSVLTYALHDVVRLCDEAGLDTIEISGSRYSRGRFFGATSPDIWLLLRPMAG
jgi:SAM-dependent methyltransferase